MNDNLVKSEKNKKENQKKKTKFENPKKTQTKCSFSTDFYSQLRLKKKFIFHINVFSVLNQRWLLALAAKHAVKLSAFRWQDPI